MKEKYMNIIGKFKDKNILVIGDVMLDKYIWGEVSRISPEAPVQVVNVKRENYVPGGAGNTASNISSLGAKVWVCGVVGEDTARDILSSELKRRGVMTDALVIDKKRPTTQKVRIIGQNQQLLRVDYESTEKNEGGAKEEIIGFIEKNIGKTDAIVISDYGKGVVTQPLINRVIKIAKDSKKIITVDPKPASGVFYNDVTLITPNQKEAAEMANIEIKTEEDLVSIGNKLVIGCNSNVLITRGPKGMSLFEKKKGGIRVTHIPTVAKQVYDVTGAGDTAVATLALALASGAELKDAAMLANLAAGIVVGKIGTSTVTADEIKGVLNERGEKEDEPGCVFGQGRNDKC